MKKIKIINKFDNETYLKNIDDEEDLSHVYKFSKNNKTHKLFLCKYCHKSKILCNSKLKVYEDQTFEKTKHKNNCPYKFKKNRIFKYIINTNIHNGNILLRYSK
jgi:hypothetical protein